MRSALQHYGPDRDGAWQAEDGSVALGSRLFRLVPEDRHDQQPLADASGRFHLVADARIDNRFELASELGVPAARLASLPDAGLILEAWKAWGAESIPKLYGDFSFGVWDAERRQLDLVRDYPGGRPLFYARPAGSVAFATMAKGLHALAEIPYAPDPATIRNLLGFVPMRGTASFFAGVERVEPGTHVSFTADGGRVIRPWYAPPPQVSEAADPRDQVADMKAMFDRAVADRLRGVAGVAATLSGGMDSGAVVASAAIQLAQNGRRLTAITHVPQPDALLVEPANRFGDEGDHARRVAALYPNIDHILDSAPGRVIGQDRDARFHYQEYPSLNLCNEVWMSEIARRASAGGRGTVVLTGAFGNFTISDHGLEHLNTLLYSGRLWRWMVEARGVLAKRYMKPLGLLKWSLRPLIRRDHLEALQRVFKRPTRNPLDYSLLRPDQIAPERYDETGQIARDRVARIVGLLWQHELVALTNKGLLARFGVDYRDPTVDRRLLDLCLSLPDSLFLRNGQLKWLYREAFGDRLPAANLDERRKGLQAADWGSRLAPAKMDLVDEARRARSNPQAQALFDVDALEQLALSMPEADAMNPDNEFDYRYRLLRTLSATHFLRKVSGGNA